MTEVGTIDDVEDEISFLNFGQGGFETLNEMWGQVLDKPNSVCQEDFLSGTFDSRIFQPERACLCGSGLLYFNGAETHNPPGVGQSLLIEDWLSKTDIYEFLRG